MENGGFVPHPFVLGGNLQTLIGHLTARHTSFPPEEVLKLSLGDGAETTVLLNLPRVSSAKTPLMILFHELGSSARDGHVSRLAKKLVQVGFRTARVNHRKHFHSGSVDDILAAMQALQHRWPKAPMTLTGLALSGSIILNLLGRNPNIAKTFPNLVGALAICPTLDIEESRRGMTPFRKRFLGRLYCHHQHQGKRSNFSMYEKTIVEQHAEFSCLEEYYQLCSPTHVVKNIKIPTLILAAADDPVNPVKTVILAPYSNDVTLKIESSGGHLGFYSKVKTRFGDKHWLDDTLIDWWLKKLKPYEDFSSNLPRSLV